MINEKDDLMKNISGNETNNLRKYLILGGGIFVLFVIGIVVSKFMFSSPKKDDTQVILPPEIQKTQKKETALFNDIPVENEFQKPTVEEKPQAQVNKIEPKKIQKPIEKIEKKEPKEVKIKTPEVETEVIQKPKPKKIVKNVKKHYYIQVAAVTRGNPSKKFLALIKKNGFNYKIQEVNVKGMKVKRVLIGGYTYKEVKKVLPKVKAKISSSAFIKRLK